MPAAYIFSACLGKTQRSAPSAARALFAGFGTTPLPQKLPIAPIFIADKISLAVSREKDGKLPFVYAGWGDAKVVEPSEVLELRAS